MITGSSVERQTKPISNVTAGFAGNYPVNMKMLGTKYSIREVWGPGGPLLLLEVLAFGPLVLLDFLLSTFGIQLVTHTITGTPVDTALACG